MRGLGLQVREAHCTGLSSLVSFFGPWASPQSSGMCLPRKQGVRLRGPQALRCLLSLPPQRPGLGSRTSSFAFALVPSCFLGQGRWQIRSCHRTCLDSFNNCSRPLGLKGPRGPALPTSHPTPGRMASLPFPSSPDSFDEACPPLLAPLSLVHSIAMSLPQKCLPRPDTRSELLSLCDPLPFASTHQARCLWSPLGWEPRVN